ncbi:hypothetical protein BH18THE2_BH18THE2_36700 [soil metagenome]
MKETIDIFNLQDQNGLPAESYGKYFGLKSDICRHKNVKLELKPLGFKYMSFSLILMITPTLWNTLDPNWKAPLAGGTTNTTQTMRFQ